MRKQITSNWLPVVLGGVFFSLASLRDFAVFLLVQRQAQIVRSINLDTLNHCGVFLEPAEPPFFFSLTCLLSIFSPGPTCAGTDSVRQAGHWPHKGTQTERGMCLYCNLRAYAAENTKNNPGDLSFAVYEGQKLLTCLSECLTNGTY